jgi:protein phosphatase
MLSDKGESRAENQDFGFAGPVPAAPQWTLLAVADGLGGHARGEWASQRTIALLLEGLGAALSEFSPPEAFERVIAHANKVLYNESRDFGWPGSATTLVAALVCGRKAWWVNVGDSRMYRLASGRLEQVSADHSVVAEQVRAGLLTPEAAEVHPHRNVVTRTVGFEPWVDVDTGGPLRLEPGDALLLCSDGLHGPVPDQVLATVLRESPPEEASERLVALANAAGGPDNITAVVAKMG